MEGMLSDDVDEKDIGNFVGKVMRDKVAKSAADRRARSELIRVENMYDNSWSSKDREFLRKKAVEEIMRNWKRATEVQDDTSVTDLGASGAASRQPVQQNGATPPPGTTPISGTVDPSSDWYKAMRQATSY
jgi:hypothetical protein